MFKIALETIYRIGFIVTIGTGCYILGKDAAKKNSKKTNDDVLDKKEEA